MGVRVLRGALAVAPVLFVIALDGACSIGELDLSGKSCPCASGYVCDPRTNTCVTSLSVGDDGAVPVDGTVPRDGFAPPVDGSSPPADGQGAGGAGGGGSPPDGSTDATGPPPTVVVSSLGNLTALAVDSANIYWATYDTTTSSGSVTSMPLPAGSVVSVASVAANVSDMVTTTSGLYLIVPGTGVLFVAPGGTPATVWSSTNVYLTDLATDGAYAYWGSVGTTNTTFYGSTGGASPSTLGTGGSADFGGIAVGGGVLYEGSLGIWQVPTGSGAVTLFANNNAQYMAIDSANVYGSNSHNNASGDQVFDLYGYALPGDASTLLAHDYGKCSDLVAAGAYVYCADSDQTALFQVDIAAHTHQAVAGASSPVAIAVDSTFVYWADDGVGGGSILKIPK